MILPGTLQTYNSDVVKVGLVKGFVLALNNTQIDTSMVSVRLADSRRLEGRRLATVRVIYDISMPESALLELNAVQETIEVVRSDPVAFAGHLKSALAETDAASSIPDALELAVPVLLIEDSGRATTKATTTTTTGRDVDNSGDTANSAAESTVKDPSSSSTVVETEFADRSIRRCQLTNVVIVILCLVRLFIPLQG